MKKITIFFVIMIITNICNITNAESNNNYWYFGPKIGWSQYNNIKLLGKDIDNQTYTHFNNISPGFFFGYQENNFLSFEMGFDWLGIIRKNIQNQNINNFFESKGLQLSTKIKIPIFKKLYLYSRFGGFFAKTINKQNNSNNTKINQSYYSVSPLFALGGEYKINKNWSSRLEYQWIKDIGNKNINDLGQKTNNSILSISILYKFVNTHQYNLPSIKNFIDNIRNKKNHNYDNKNLVSKVFFNFDDFNLRKETKKTLDKIINNNKKNHKKFSNTELLILGHSDYLGKKNYNVSLSKKRAKKVIEYLIFKTKKNAFYKKITVKGLGSLPINKKCINIKNYKLLKKCLVLDRYVEIKFVKYHKIYKFYFNKNFISDNNLKIIYIFINCKK
ncbi:OmpA family protein [Enterobacteriaceae endosymbiont of Donacia versicolorea]|uniref:OmpA family protein n=1 Tax=Enterobacteriaceae endosymbiont of Donacia versicolorea TaxID=2675788 RepID=UPI001448EE4A|nr:OmpA family protein [Enterobacteriaceae endosymbiont of Donacia versicolorea]QJC32048.1 OmpA family protein [Enterobacteriaceae endosymbiont of Donacia versicolorea]